MKNITLAPKVRVQLIRENHRSFASRLVETPSAAAAILKYLKLMDREHLVALHLNARNELISTETVSIGSLTAALVSPREVFKGAILANAAGIILAHNHPSGSQEPSPEDKETTKRIARAGDLMGIPLLDHLIVADSGFYSFRERGQMPTKSQWVEG